MMRGGSLRRKDLSSSVETQYLKSLPPLHLDELCAYLPFFDPLQDPQIGDWVLITPMRRAVLLDPLVAMWEDGDTDKNSFPLPSFTLGENNNHEEKNYHHHSTPFSSSLVPPHRYTLAEYFSVFSSPMDASDTIEGKGISLPLLDETGQVKVRKKKVRSVMHPSRSTDGSSFSSDTRSSRCLVSPPNDTECCSRREHAGSRRREKKRGKAPLTTCGEAFLLSHERVEGRSAEEEGEEMTCQWKWEETGEEAVEGEGEPIDHSAVVPPARMFPAPSFVDGVSFFFSPPSDEENPRSLSDWERTGEECRTGTVEGEIVLDHCDAAPSSFATFLPLSPVFSSGNASFQGGHSRRAALRAQRRVASFRGDCSPLGPNATEMKVVTRHPSQGQGGVPSLPPHQPSPSSSLLSPLPGSPPADLSGSFFPSTSTPLPAPTRGTFGPILAPLSSMLFALTKRKRHHRVEGEENMKPLRQRALLFLHVRLGLLTSTPPIEFGGGTLACRKGGEKEGCGGGTKEVEWNVDRTLVRESLRNEVWTLLAPDRPGGYMRRVWVWLPPDATACATEFPAAILREADTVRTLPSSLLDPYRREGIEEVPSDEQREKFERLTRDDFQHVWLTQIECVAEGQWECWASQEKKEWRSKLAGVSKCPIPPEKGSKESHQLNNNSSTEVKERRNVVASGGETTSQEKVGGAEKNLMRKYQKIPSPLRHSSLLMGEEDHSSGALSTPKALRNTETKVFISPPFPSTTLYARTDQSNTVSSSRTPFHRNKNT